MLFLFLLQPKHTQTHTKTITIFLFLSFFLFEQTKQNHISFSFFLLVRTNKATQNTIFGFCVSTQTQKQPNENKRRKKNNLPTCQKFASLCPRGGDQRRGVIGVAASNGSPLPMPHRTARYPNSSAPCALMQVYQFAR